MSRKRRLGSLSRQRRNVDRTDNEVDGDSAAQSGSLLTTATIRSVTSSP